MAVDRVAAVRCLSLVLLAVCFPTACSWESINLSGSGWTLDNQSGNENVTQLATSLPGYALQALQDADIIGEPLYRFGERDYGWVANDTWTWTRSFQASHALVSQKQVDLLVRGLDTIADVYINDILVAQTSNVHRDHHIPIKKWINTRSNTIRLVIHPAIKGAFANSAQYPYHVPSLYDVKPTAQVAPFNFLRKPASDFGWDWGPAFAPAGVSGGVEVVGYSAAYLKGALILQTHNDDGSVDLDFKALLMSAEAGELGTLAITSPDNETWATSVAVSIPLQGENVVSVTMTIPGGIISRWWPVGYGAQPLYSFTITYTSASDTTAASRVQRRVGFRTVELVQEPISNFTDKLDRTFYFKINGMPIFAKGANLIPLDIIPSKATPQGLQAMVADAVAANMNMLRVWGGGEYPLDALYDACDETGILIWQESMFACGLYPRDAGFLAEVRREITFQAIRLNSHPSIAIWGGNNEIEAAFQWYNESRSNPKLYAVDYNELFIDTVHSALTAVDPTVVWVDSSPSKGLLSAKPYVKSWEETYLTDKGDVHFYDTDNKNDPWDYKLYPRAKFVSEFGFQSFPSFSAYQKQSSSEDWSYNSSATAFRQRHPPNTELMLFQLSKHFAVPPPEAGQNATVEEQAGLFKAWIYLTQVWQARAYEVASSLWRRIKHEPDGSTMGILYWQLNDIWAGFSWSSIDWDGHWRLLHYNARRFFAPLVVSGQYDPTTGFLTAYVTSDIPQPVAGTFTLDLVPWKAGPQDGPLQSLTSSFVLNPLDSKITYSDKVAILLAAAKVLPKDVMVRLSVEATLDTAGLVQPPDNASIPVSEPKGTTNQPVTGSLPGNKLVASYEIYLTEPKDAGLNPSPNITLSHFSMSSANAVTFQVSSKGIALFTVLETYVPGVFSDNNFLLLPWEPKTIKFTARDASQLQQFVLEGLSVVSLADTL